MNTRTIKRRIEVQRRKSERITAYRAYRESKILNGEDYQTYPAWMKERQTPTTEVETSQN